VKCWSVGMVPVTYLATPCGVHQLRAAGLRPGAFVAVRFFAETPMGRSLVGLIVRNLPRKCAQRAIYLLAKYHCFCLRPHVIVEGHHGYLHH